MHGGEADGRSDFQNGAGIRCLRQQGEKPGGIRVQGARALPMILVLFPRLRIRRAHVGKQGRHLFRDMHGVSIPQKGRPGAMPGGLFYGRRRQ